MVRSKRFFSILVVSVLVFAFVHLLPGDPARTIAGPEASAEDVANIRQGIALPPCRRARATRGGV